MSKAWAVPNSSTCTEWSMTSSTGCRGLMSAGSPPRVCMASRMAARSTTQGTPVKSCRRTRLGGEGDFFFGLGILVPGGEGADFFFADIASVFGAEKILEEDAQGERKMLGGDSLLVEGVEAEDFVFFGADFEGGFGVETVYRHLAFLEGAHARVIRRLELTSVILLGGIAGGRHSHHGEHGGSQRKPYEERLYRKGRKGRRRKGREENLCKLVNSFGGNCGGKALTTGGTEDHRGNLRGKALSQRSQRKASQRSRRKPCKDC